MTSQPGWYPDAQQPGQQRYWDGQRWTEHVAPLAALPAGYGGYPAGYQAGPPTTPDGQQLAGWWQRVGAQVIDGLIVSVIGFVAALPFWLDLLDAYGDYFSDAMDAAENGGSSPSAMTLQADNFGTFVAVVLIGLLVNFVYVVGFLAWKQATPGKLALGLRVRLRDRPGPLPLGAILRRWLVQALPTAGGAVPYVGSLIGLFALLDVLWPLWDSNKQALHDKAAGTNVVRVTPGV